METLDPQPVEIIQHSNELDELAKALTKFQSEVPSIPRNKTVRVKTRSGGTYSFDYAPLETIIDYTKKELSENGLAVTQLPTFNGSVTTLLLHESGQYIRFETGLDNDNDKPSDMQDMGSRITYNRRYALGGVLGLATDEDDDANIASGNTIQNKKTRQKKDEDDEKTTARDLRGVKSSTDMNVNKAIAYIRDTDPDKLDDFVTEEEDRITIQRVWDSKMGTNFSGEYPDNKTEDKAVADGRSTQDAADEAKPSKNGTERTVQDAIDEIVNSDLDPTPKVNKLVQELYQPHTNPSHKDFENREFSQYEPKEFQDKFYSEIQKAIGKVQS